MSALARLFVVLFFLSSSWLMPASAQEAQFPEDFPGKFYDFYGSTVKVIVHRELIEIQFVFPKPGLSPLIERGTVFAQLGGNPKLDPSEDPHVEGTSYEYARDCAPIPYRVTGEFSRDLSKLTLRGSFPVTDPNCHVVAWRNTVQVLTLDNRPIGE